MANPLGCQQASKTLDYLRSMPSRLAAGLPSPLIKNTVAEPIILYI